MSNDLDPADSGNKEVEFREEIIAKMSSLATKDELKSFEKVVGEKIQVTETTLRKEIKDTATALRQEIKDTETTLRQEIKDTATTLRQEMKEIEIRLSNKIKDTETKLRQEIKDTEIKLRKEIGNTETKLRKEIKDTEIRLRKEIKDTETKLRNEIKATEKRLKKEIDIVREEGKATRKQTEKNYELISILQKEVINIKTKMDTFITKDEFNLKFNMMLDGQDKIMGMLLDVRQELAAINAFNNRIEKTQQQEVKRNDQQDVQLKDLDLRVKHLEVQIP